MGFYRHKLGSEEKESGAIKTDGVDRRRKRVGSVFSSIPLGLGFERVAEVRKN